MLLIASTISATSTTEGSANNGVSVVSENLERMIDVTNDFPFDFNIVSLNEDYVVVRFISPYRIVEYPYIGIKGTSTVADKVTEYEYILEYGEEYSFVYTCTESGLEVVYNAVIYLDESTLDIVVEYAIKNIISETLARSSGTIYESESNNTMSTADVTSDDRDNYGSISSLSDVDWWKVSFIEGGRANFWLGNIPSGCNYELSIYNASGGLLSYSYNARNTAELIQYDVSPNTTYYIKIESSYGTSNIQYLLRVKNYANTTWFSQLNGSVGSTWNTTNLTSLYFPNMLNCANYCDSVYKCANTPFYTTSNYIPASNQLDRGHINKFGCSISAMAMIFRNLGVTTVDNKYDFRNGTTTNQQADPFTLTMANIGWPTVTINTSNGITRYEITTYQTTYNPTNANWYTASTAFGLTATKVPLDGLTAEEKADAIAYYIEQNPEGILVRVASSHSLVFTDTTHTAPSSLNLVCAQPCRITSANELEILQQELEQERNFISLASVTTTEYDDKFTCYDPGTSTPQIGRGVTYNNSWTASIYGGIDQIVYIYYFD